MPAGRLPHEMGCDLADWTALSLATTKAVERVRDHLVVAHPTVHPVSEDSRRGNAVVARASLDGVAAGSAIQVVVARSADQQVIASTTSEIVVAGAAIQAVPPAFPGQPIVTSTSADYVVSPATADDVGAVAADDHVRSGCSSDGCM